MSDIKHLMIKTKDDRQFFTNVNNYTDLQKFSEVFDVEISIVNAQNVKSLTLEELAYAICNNVIPNTAIEDKILNIKMPPRQNTRKNMRQTAKKIKDYIQQKLLKGETVSLRDLANTFKSANVTSSCLCNHMSQVRSELNTQGYKVVKIGGGKYSLKK